MASWAAPVNPTAGSSVSGDTGCSATIVPPFLGPVAVDVVVRVETAVETLVRVETAVETLVEVETAVETLVEVNTLVETDVAVVVDTEVAVVTAVVVTGGANVEDIAA